MEFPGGAVLTPPLPPPTPPKECDELSTLPAPVAMRLLTPSASDRAAPPSAAAWGLALAAIAAARHDSSAPLRYRAFASELEAEARSNVSGGPCRP